MLDEMFIFIFLGLVGLAFVILAALAMVAFRKFKVG
jgi:hypothetical protein